MFEKLTTIQTYTNPHFVSRYVKFIKLRQQNPKIKGITSHHHILPKAKDFFPEYKNLKKFPENGVHLTDREHYIAHLILSKAFPYSSQVRAFYCMTNVLNKRTSSKEYEIARQAHYKWLKSQDRGLAISRALKGKPKSQKHIQSMIGHEVSESTRQKLRLANSGKKATDSARQKMSASRLGKKRKPHSDQGKENISLAKTGTKWFNNGIISIQAFAAPDNTWNLGRLITTEYVCPHCSKSGFGASMFRWHFNGCKQRPPNICQY